MQTSALALLVLLLVAAPGAAYDRKEWPMWASVGTWKADDGAACQADVRDAAVKRQALHGSLTIDRGKGGECLVDADVLDIYGGHGLILKGAAKDLDHVIPLGYVGTHGGDAWAPSAKRRYANDLSYRFHLVVVNAHDNRQKGDKGPKDWIPANAAAWCGYGTWWATIAARWRLTLDAGDLTAIQKLTDTC